MNFVLYRLLYRRKASQPERRLLGLIDMIRSALPHIDPDRVQPLAAFEPPQQGFLICYPRHESDGQRLVRELLRKRGVRFEEHLLGPEPVPAGGAPQSAEAREAQKSRLMESGRFFAQMGLVEDALPLLQDAVTLDPGCVESSQHLVAVLRQLNRSAEAEGVLRRALRHQPNTPAFHLLMGTHLLDLGRCEEAVEAFKQGIRLEPRAPVLYAQLGTALYRQGELEPAEAAFAEALSRDEHLAIALVGMGETLLEQGRLEEAATYLHKSLEEDDEAPEARLKLGWCHYHLGLLERAEVDFLSAANEPSDPYWAAARFSLGRLYLERGSLDLCREVLTEVCRREPDFSEAHRFLAECCTLQGDHASALKHWREVERIEPDRSLSLQPSLAVCLSRLGRNEEAEACLYGCLDKMGAHPYLFQLLATVMMAQEQWERAREALRVAEQLDPESCATQFEIAWVEENLGHFEVARERYNRVLRLDPECVEAYSGLGWLYLQEGKPEIALVLFEKCLELKGPESDVLDTLGWVYLLQGEQLRALALFEQAIALEPGMGLARAHRAAALASLDRVEEARQELLRAVEIDPDDEEVLGYARDLARQLSPLPRQLSRALGKRRRSPGSRTQHPKVSQGNQARSWNKYRVQSDVDFWEDYPEGSDELSTG
ncbi:MAG: hypothetical protein AMXMBFR33_70190 [Candidatus Xenobia bacterium]